mgnify:CR=1 FL=1
MTINNKLNKTIVFLYLRKNNQIENLSFSSECYNLSRLRKRSFDTLAFIVIEIVRQLVSLQLYIYIYI